jgi:hypothetical protein
MRYLLAIDDTDQKDWPGTGHLLEKIRKSITENGWGITDSITRHQLFVHPSVPYTSHNSVMCFAGEISQRKEIGNIIDLAISYLTRESAPEADPGLCVVFTDEVKYPERLISFGQKAKIKKLSKQDAYQLAEQLSLHLSEHGGTGDGVIGALAGTGLRLSGDDGRFRGSHFILDQVIKYKVDVLCHNWKIDQVCTENGEPLSGEEYVFLEGKIKTVLKNNQSVLLVKKYQEQHQAIWKNLNHSEVKSY